MKKLLLSTAFIAVTASAGLAAGHDANFRTEADPMEIHASAFIGKRVYSSEAEIEGDAYDGVQADWEDIGEINDVIMSRDGQVEAVLVDIGGFLGIGERQVAVDMQSIRFVADDATAEDLSDYFLVMSAPRAMLEEAPEYKGYHDAAMMKDSAEESVDTAAENVEETAEAAAENVEETAEAAAETTEAAAENAAAEMREPIMREGYMAAEQADLTTEMLTGAPVYDATDEWIGEVSELIIDTEGKITNAVIDVGGFLGIGEKPVELKIGDVDILRADGGTDLRVYVPMTKEELEALPTYNQ